MRSGLTQVVVRFVTAIGFVAVFSTMAWAQAGRLDPTFSNFIATGANITAVEMQADGKLLVAGKFTTVGAIIRKDIARLNTDGSVDPAFNSGTGSDNIGMILAMKIQPDGKVVVCGSFNTINGTPHNAVARLNPDGSVDAGFGVSGLDITFAYDMDLQPDGKILVSASNLIGSSFIARLNANITAVEMQADGKLLVAGKFTTVGAIIRKDIARLNTDGSVDPAFNSGTGSDNIGMILAMKIQPDGKVVVCGSFNTINGTPHNAVARLNPDGSVDAGFGVSGLDITFAYDMDLQPDGKILVSASNLIGSSFIARLNSNGANDGGTGQSFFSVPPSYEYRVSFLTSENQILVTYRMSAPNSNRINIVKVSVTGGQDMSFSAAVFGDPSDIQASARAFLAGKVLVWGRFNTANQTARNNVAVLNSDGTTDMSFDPMTSASGTILAAAVQSDGKVLLAGRDFAVNTFIDRK